MADDNSMLAIILPLSIIAILIALALLIPLLCRRYCFKCWNDIFCYECCRGTGFCMDCCHDMGCDCPCGPVVEDYPKPGRYPDGYKLGHVRQSSNPPRYDANMPEGHSPYTPTTPTITKQPTFGNNNNNNNNINTDAFQSTTPTLGSSTAAWNQRTSDGLAVPSETKHLDNLMNGVVPLQNDAAAITSTYETPRSHTRYDTPPHGSLSSNDVQAAGKGAFRHAGTASTTFNRNNGGGDAQTVHESASSSGLPTPPRPDYHNHNTDSLVPAVSSNYPSGSNPYMPSNRVDTTNHYPNPVTTSSSTIMSPATPAWSAPQTPPKNVPSGWSYQPLMNGGSTTGYNVTSYNNNYTAAFSPTTAAATTTTTGLGSASYTTGQSGVYFGNHSHAATGAYQHRDFHSSSHYTAQTVRVTQREEKTALKYVQSN